MWIRHVVCVAVVVALGCGSEEDNSQAGTGGASGTAGMMTTGGTGGMAGMSAATGGTGGMMATGTGGAAGTMPTLCPADPGITMCGTEACPMVSEALGAICVQTCCTTDTKCGTGNALMAGMCTAPVMNTTMCPNEMIMGSMVPGCCVEGGNECGIINLLTDMSCIGRASVPAFLATLPPMNCDGTPVTMEMPDAGTTDAGATDAGM